MARKGLHRLNPGPKVEAVPVIQSDLSGVVRWPDLIRQQGEQMKKRSGVPVPVGEVFAELAAIGVLPSADGTCKGRLSIFNS